MRAHLRVSDSADRAYQRNGFASVRDALRLVLFRRQQARPAQQGRLLLRWLSWQDSPPTSLSSRSILSGS